MSRSALSLAELRRVDLFGELDDDELTRWLEVAQVYEVTGGEILAELGEPASVCICCSKARCRS